MIYIRNDIIEECKKYIFIHFNKDVCKMLNLQTWKATKKINLTVIIVFMKFKCQFYGLNKKIQNARKNCFSFSEIVKLALQIDSRISNVNIYSLLKLPMSIM